jgi:hypothetical protein
MEFFMKINIKNKFALIAIAAFSFLATSVANAGVNRSLGARSVHTNNYHGSARSSGGFNINRTSNLSYPGSRGTLNHTGNTLSTESSMTHTGSTSFIGNNGNTATRDGNTSINTHSNGEKEALHSSKTVIVKQSVHESIHRDTNMSIKINSDGTKNLDHSVSAESNSVGTPINGRQASTHLSTQTNTFTHNGWALVNAADGRTSATHYGNTSVSTDTEGVKYIDHTATTAKSIEEAVVSSHEADTHISINPH